MKTLRTIVIVIVFSTLLLQSAFFVAKAQNSSATVIVEGNETKTIENGTYSIDQIIVRNSSTLTIQNAKILSKAGYQNWSISVRDNAKLIMINSTIMNSSGALLESATRKPDGDYWLADPITGDPIPSFNIELDGNSVSSTITGSVVYGAISVRSGPGSDLFLSNSTFYYVDVGGNGTNVIIANSTALTDYGSIHGRDTVKISDSSFEGFDLVLARSTDLSLTPGLVNSWEFHNTLSFENESYDLLIQNTRIGSWGVQLYGDGNTILNIYNSKITHLTNHANIMRVYSSNVTYYDTIGSDFIQNSNISQVQMAFLDKNDFVLENSVATTFIFTIWTPRMVEFSNLRENTTDPRILPEGQFGYIKFTNTQIKYWYIEMLPQSQATVEILNSSMITYLLAEGNSRASIDQTSNLDNILVAENGTVQIQKVIQCLTQDGTPIKQASFRLLNNGTTVLETKTDDDGRVFFYATLDAKNYSLCVSKLFFDIPSVSSTIDWGNSTRRVLLGWAGDVLEPENATMLNMNSPITLQANLETQYQLKVDSPLSVVNGSGWYRAGSTANFSVAPPQGNIIVQEIFTGWTGDSTSSETAAQTVMDKPKTVTATWRIDYTQVYLFISAVIVIAIVATIAFVSSSRRGTFKPQRGKKNPGATGKANPMKGRP